MTIVQKWQTDGVSISGRPLNVAGSGVGGHMMNRLGSVGQVLCWPLLALGAWWNVLSGLWPFRGSQCGRLRPLLWRSVTMFWSRSRIALRCCCCLKLSRTRTWVMGCFQRNAWTMWNVTVELEGGSRKQKGKFLVFILTELKFSIEGWFCWQLIKLATEFIHPTLWLSIFAISIFLYISILSLEVPLNSMSSSLVVPWISFTQ